MSSGEEFPHFSEVKLFGGLAHVYVDKLQCHYLTTNSFRPNFINQVFVINKDHYSNCRYYSKSRMQLPGIFCAALWILSVTHLMFCETDFVSAKKT